MLVSEWGGGGGPEGRAGRKRVGPFKDLLKGTIPEEVLKLIPRSYDIVGDIALINLPQETMAYWRAVGEAILATNKNVRAVYAVGMTVGDFRVREMKHVAGEEVTATVHKEYGIRVYVDLSKAYYNPSLSEERRRVADEVVEGESVLDLFAGVGPFTLHIVCSKRVYVLANDLNPHAVGCLLKSLELNRKAIKGFADVVNSDAAEILNALRCDTFHRAILNLPHRSADYLSKVLNVLKDGGVAYTYLIATDPSEAVNTASKNLPKHGYAVGKVVRVLDYAPRKYVFRVEVVKKG